MRISKLQYSLFEPGEFVDETERTLASTLELINQFPWEQQRQQLRVSLTNPSVTIHGNNNDFLKFALYYNRGFVLHYLDGRGVVYTKSFSAPQDAYPFITLFFNDGYYDVSSWKKESAWLKNNLLHFKTRNFQTDATLKSLLKYIWKTSAFQLCLTLILSLVMLIFPEDVDRSVSFAWILSLFFYSCNLVLILNLWFRSRHKILVLSRGINTFLFGHKDNPVLYRKSDIVSISVARTTSDRSPIQDLALIKLQMTDTTIIIPSLLLRCMLVEYKFPGIAIEEENTIPWAIG